MCSVPAASTLITACGDSPAVFFIVLWQTIWAKHLFYLGSESMKAKDIRNYYRGWGEWGNAEKAPVVVPTKAEEE